MIPRIKALTKLVGTGSLYEFFYRTPINQRNQLSENALPKKVNTFTHSSHVVVNGNYYKGPDLKRKGPL